MLTVVSSHITRKKTCNLSLFLSARNGKETSQILGGMFRITVFRCVMYNGELDD